MEQQNMYSVNPPTFQQPTTPQNCFIPVQRPTSVPVNSGNQTLNHASMSNEMKMMINVIKQNQQRSLENQAKIAALDDTKLNKIERPRMSKTQTERQKEIQKNLQQLLVMLREYKALNEKSIKMMDDVFEVVLKIKNEE